MAAHSTPVLEWEVLRERDPASLALALPEQSVTVGELESAARHVAGELVRAGVDQGDRVVLATPASARFVAAFLAVRLIGAVAVNLPWQWRRELVAVATEADARAVLLPEAWSADSALAPVAARVLPPDPSVQPIATEPVSRGGEDPAWLAYTSGTTGLPKGALHTEATLAYMPAAFIDRYALGPDDSILVSAPVGHAVGLVYGVVLALRSGCPMALVPRWDRSVAAQLCQRHRCTFTAGPTPLLHDVVETAETEQGGAFATLGFFLSGGAAVPPSLLERASVAMPSTETSAYFGTSECGGVTTCQPGTPAEKVFSTVGTTLPGMEVSLADGELLVRGRQLARGYYAGDPERRFRPDGWYETGDLAELDADGFVRITGRRTEIIRRGGVAISPFEVETVLVTHPRVREAAVVGVGDPRLGERIAAAVVPRGRPPTLDELRACCSQAGLAAVKWPETIVVVTDLARSPAGKLSRIEIRREVEARE